MCEFCGTDNCGGFCATDEQLEALMDLDNNLVDKDQKGGA
jgi:hypothetical protein